MGGLSYKNQHTLASYTYIYTQSLSPWRFIPLNGLWIPSQWIDLPSWGWSWRWSIRGFRGLGRTWLRRVSGRQISWGLGCFWRSWNRNLGNFRNIRVLSPYLLYVATTHSSSRQFYFEHLGCDCFDNHTWQPFVSPQVVFYLHLISRLKRVLSFDLACPSVSAAFVRLSQQCSVSASLTTVQLESTQ